jgi:hypothetical protein
MNYHYPLRNIAEERRSHLLRGGSLKLRMMLNERESMILAPLDRNYTTRLPSGQKHFSFRTCARAKGLMTDILIFNASFFAILVS